MSDGAHLLIPFASGPAAGRGEALPALTLPHLQKLLARMGEPAIDAAHAQALSPPHERAWARHHGLAVPDGLVPLAAAQARAEGLETGDRAWAWITPCHWTVGRDHIAMGHPEALALDAAASAALLAAVQPLFEGDGIALFATQPHRWLARAEQFRALPTASLDRAAGRVIDAWMPRDAAARPVRRLQQEVQMLLYTHPLTDEWQRSGQLPVNSFWVSGTGALPAGFSAKTELQVADALRNPALHGDADAWRDAWHALDAGPVQQWLRRAEAGESLRLTLAGEAESQSWSTAAGGGWRRLLHSVRPASPQRILEALA